MSASLEERVKNLICDQLAVEAEKVTPTASFIEDLGADSLDTVELVMAFEEEFGAEIPDEDAEKLTNVGAVIDYLAKFEAPWFVFIDCDPETVPLYERLGFRCHAPHFQYPRGGVGVGGDAHDGADFGAGGGINEGAEVAGEVARGGDGR